MTQAIQQFAVSALHTNNWAFLPTNTTTSAVEGIFIVKAQFELPTKANRVAHGTAKTVSELASHYEADPRKAAAMTRARGKLARRLEGYPELSLAQLRLEKGLSQSKLGELMGGVAQPQIARIERGDDIKISTIEKLSLALGVTAEQVLTAMLATRSAKGDEKC
jgi:DNA-binding Xre family transcriptional regulator